MGFGTVRNCVLKGYNYITHLDKKLNVVDIEFHWVSSSNTISLAEQSSIVNNSSLDKMHPTIQIFLDFFTKISSLHFKRDVLAISDTLYV